MNKTENTNDLSTLNPIRVETALSRYPVHRLAKHGDIAIDIRERSESGEISIKWEVNHNSKYGQPGPLAYKLDTLLINRRIEESSRPIPRIIRLGSLRDICRELGISEGKNKDSIKKSLFQNASSFITAKIHYRQKDGQEKSLEAGFNRYNVVLTGEKLPDGRKADAVYIILSDVYLQVIGGAMTRPLDYDYLKSLPPAPQRFYELLSYQMYAAIKNDRPRARLLYSELCTYAPLVRQTEWNVVRPQLARLHAHHKKSGYLGKIDCQSTVDSEGKPDWIMLYQPGPKARAEFRAFTKRGGPVLIEVEPLTAEAVPQIADHQPTLREAELIARSITAEVAAELVRQHSDEKINIQIEVFDWLREIKDKKVSRSPAGYLVKSITTGEKGYAIPEGFVSKAERQQREESRREKERQTARERRLQQEAEARQRQELGMINAYWDGLDAVGQERLMANALAQSDPELLALTKGPMRKLGLQILRDRHIRTLLEAEGKLIPVEE